MQIETGEIDEFEEATVNMNKSWFDNQYLKKRIKELSFVLDEIDPYQPVSTNVIIPQHFPISHIPQFPISPNIC